MMIILINVCCRQQFYYNIDQIGLVFVVNIDVHLYQGGRARKRILQSQCAL